MRPDAGPFRRARPRHRVYHLRLPDGCDGTGRRPGDPLRVPYAARTRARGDLHLHRADARVYAHDRRHGAFRPRGLLLHRPDGGRLFRAAGRQCGGRAAVFQGGGLLYGRFVPDDGRGVHQAGERTGRRRVYLRGAQARHRLLRLCRDCRRRGQHLRQVRL